MGQLSQEEINVDLFDEVMRLKGELRKVNEKADGFENVLREISEANNPTRLANCPRLAKEVLIKHCGK